MAPRFAQRREHRRPRPHDHVEPPVRDLEPRPVPRTLVPPDEHRDPLPERLHDRRRGRRHRHRLRHQHDRPPPPGQTRPNRLDGDGHLVLRSRPNHERPRPGRERRRERRAVPIRREEVRGRGLSSVGGGGPAERGMGWLGKRSGAAAATPPRASPPQRRPPPRRPEAAPPSRSPRPAARRTARSPTASARSMSSSKNRTGDTTFFTPSIRVPNDSEGPSTHPRISRPWNGTCTSDPTPASSSGGSRYVNGRSRLRTGRSTQTATGPSKRFVARGVAANAVVGRANRRRGGGRRRGRSPPRGTLCVRSVRTRPSRDRWDGRAADRG